VSEWLVGELLCIRGCIMSVYWGIANQRATASESYRIHIQGADPEEVNERFVIPPAVEIAIGHRMPSPLLIT
jgi:hypothetical protein